MEGSLKITDNEKSAYAIDSAVGIAGGYAAYKYLPQYIKRPYLKYCIRKDRSIIPAKQKEYWDSAINAFKNSKFFNSNVEIIHTDKTNWKNVAQKVIEEQEQQFEIHKGNSIIRFIKKLLMQSESKIKNHINIIAQGENASFYPVISKILVNRDKLGVATFHEIGHSINFNGAGLRKILALSRLSAKAVPVIVGVGLVTPKREEGDEYKNSIGKTATFIKNHCGLLAGLLMLPVVAEEGLASFNGAKLAKNLLNQDMYKSLNKFNTTAFGSYVLSALTIGVFASLAVYVKDKISGKAPVRDKNN